MDGYVNDIASIAITNEDFRRVLCADAEADNEHWDGKTTEYAERELVMHAKHGTQTRRTSLHNDAPHETACEETRIACKRSLTLERQYQTARSVHP